jgi:hypothetical protein
VSCMFNSRLVFSIIIMSVRKVQSAVSSCVTSLTSSFHLLLIIELSKN